MRRTRGFTLTELMLVIALVGIMTAITFVSFAGKRDDEALKSAAREVAAAIRGAQSNALSGVRKPSSSNGLCFQQIKAEGSDTYATYVVHLKNNKTNCQDLNEIDNPYQENIFSLGNGVTFQDSSWKVSFDVPRGDFDAPYSSSAAPVKIVLMKNGKYSAVCVLSSGVVIEKSVSTGVPSCP